MAPVIRSELGKQMALEFSTEKDGKKREVQVLWENSWIGFSKP
jgi:hypothetical protein